ncbi:ARM repeat-containing protein [Pleurotus eryngii]|uniref:ARM repeat-containing protein n=1 Tax=Pleurotus eryngii TaxID=5323 RepID=A0A9P5ZUI6_PLEER|nr:ARM repeat-containing protein [Pleurotus eryngii]
MNTINVLVNNSDTHQKLLQSSIIHDLVDLSKSRPLLIVLAKLKVIAQLIRYDPLRAEILRSGFLDSLFEENGHLINDSARQLQTAAFEIILQFIEHNDSRSSILGHDIFTVLLQKSFSKYPHIRTMAVKVIAASSFQADTYERMLEQSFTSSLFEAIQQTSFYALSALQVITFMVPHDTLRHGLLEANLPIYLQEKLGDQSNYVIVLVTLKVLSRLLDYEDSRSLLNIEGLIEQTVKLTDHENPNIRQQVIVMLTTMLKFDHTRKKFLDVDVLFDLKWLLRGQDTEVSMVYCLYEMTKYGALVWFSTGWGFLR